MVNTHGLATSIRNAQESETFDLGGQNVATITHTIEAAFQEPFEHGNFSSEPGGMIRLTFVTGAGKQARAKYDDGAAKAITSTLSRLGYAEDRGSSCVVECAGTYKQQHDTGKNLKTVVVFPNISSTSSNHPNNDNNGELQHNNGDLIIPENSAGYKIGVASMTVFENMFCSKCPSWSDKKGCLSSLEGLQSILQELEEKLMGGTPLDDAEQQFFDSMVMLSEKDVFVKKEMHDQVDRGDITKQEKDFLLHQVGERIVSLEKQNKPAVKPLQRKKVLQDIKPINPYPLAYESEITKLRKELAPLLTMEADGKGRLLSIKETQTLARKDEILVEIGHLEEASQGWFEDDDSFHSRLEASHSRWKADNANKSKKPASRKTASGAVSSNKISTGWASQGRANLGRKVAAPKVKASAAGGGSKKGSDVFSAMMAMGDDSSDDE
jgi:hypothetical protein